MPDRIGSATPGLSHGVAHVRCARALCGAAAAARLPRLVGRARRRLVAAHGTGGLVATGGARARRHRRRLSALRALARCPAAVSDLFVALTPPNLLARSEERRVGEGCSAR